MSLTTSGHCCRNAELEFMVGLPWTDPLQKKEMEDGINNQGFDRNGLFIQPSWNRMEVCNRNKKIKLSICGFTENVRTKCAHGCGCSEAKDQLEQQKSLLPQSTGCQ